MRIPMHIIRALLSLFMFMYTLSELHKYNTFLTRPLNCIKYIIYCVCIMPFSLLIGLLWIFKKARDVASWTKGTLYMLGNEYRKSDHDVESGQSERPRVEQLERELRSKEDEITQREVDCRKAHSSIDQLERELRSKEHEITKWEVEFQKARISATAMKIKLNEKEEEIMALKTNLNDMTQRLAAEMSTKLSADESTFENISIQARPMKIAEEYSLLFSNTWLDAKNALDDILSLRYHKSDQQSPQKEATDVTAASVENHADEYNGSKSKTTLEQPKDSTYANTKDVCLDEKDNMEAGDSSGIMVQEVGTETKGCDAPATCEEKGFMEYEHPQETMDYTSASVSTAVAGMDVNGHYDKKIYVRGNNDEDLEEWKNTFLQIILSTSWTKASELYKQRMKQLLFAAKNPANAMDIPEDGDEMPNTQSTTLISDLMRNNAEKANLDNLEKSVVAECSRWPHYDKCMNDEKVRDYLQECTRIAWKMVIQRPPMMLVCDQVGKSWSQCEGLEPIWNSKPNNPGATVKYYKHPQLYHSNRCMVKGYVYVA